MKKANDNNKVFGALLTDFSKAFDCICHYLLVAKLNAYGLSLPALKLLQNYLQNRKQRTKVWLIVQYLGSITSGVPRGSILGPLLFNIFLCDLFFEDKSSYFANYADDTTPYTVGSHITEVLTNLSCHAQKLFTCFANNQTKANYDKCHLTLSTQDSARIQVDSYNKTLQ